MHLTEFLELLAALRPLRAVVRDTSKAFNSAWHAGLCRKFKSYGVSDQIFGLPSFLSNRHLQVAFDRKPPQKYINVGALIGFILGPTIFLLYINDLSDVICNIESRAEDTTLYYNFGQTYDLW